MPSTAGTRLKRAAFPYVRANNLCMNNPRVDFRGVIGLK